MSHFPPLTEVNYSGLSARRYLDVYPVHHLSAHWLERLKRAVWMHRGRLNECHEFQRSGVSTSLKSQWASQAWHTHPLIQTPTSITFAGEHGKCDRLFCALQLLVVLVWVSTRACVRERDLALFVPRSLSPPFFSRFCALASVGAVDLCGEFDALIRASRVFSKATLHVRSACAEKNALPYWYTFYAKWRARGGAEGRADWRTRHMDRGRGSPWPPGCSAAAANWTDCKHWAAPNVVQSASFKRNPVCTRKCICATGWMTHSMTVEAESILFTAVLHKEYINKNPKSKSCYWNCFCLHGSFCNWQIGVTVTWTSKM